MNTTNRIQSGLAKSGNFWLYSILKELISTEHKFTTNIQTSSLQAHLEELKLSTSNQNNIDVLEIANNRAKQQISSFYKMPLLQSEKDDFIKQSSLIWTHSKINGSLDIYKHFDQAVYIIRDPRAVAVSLAHFALSDYMQKFFPSNFNSVEEVLKNNFTIQIDKWCRHVASAANYHDQSKLHVVFFENLKSNPHQHIKAIADHLGIVTDKNTINRVVEQTSFNTMKNENPSHVRQGKATSWKGILTPQQLNYAESRAGKLLECFGYETKKQAQFNELTWCSEKVKSIDTSFNYSRVLSSLKRRSKKFLFK